ncbi:MAG: nitronate monooxygenase [Paracoccaceae bacterium]|jgi:nitronate monooxygenase
MIKTRLTENLNLKHPVVLAPMAVVGGGRLAAEITRAGGLGLIGGGYCDADWIDQEFAQAGDTPVGCGLITWCLSDDLLASVLARKPLAILLSFGDPLPFSAAIHAAEVPLICQVQTLKDARRAVVASAAIIVAQGSEAGGHIARRSTMTLVPEIADMLAVEAPDVLLLAAGGIADGRGLAAALMLGADGVSVGSAFLASDEVLLHANAQTAIFAADGDATMRTSVPDILRSKDWKTRYSGRILANDFIRRWHEDEAALRVDPSLKTAWADATARGDMNVASIFVGEAAGMIHKQQAAADILNNMVAGATAILDKQVGRNV